MLGALGKADEGDIVLLHVTCHNPTGVDPTPAQWETIADIAVEAGWMPFFDFAYQGFGESVEADFVAEETPQQRDLDQDAAPPGRLVLRILQFGNWPPALAAIRDVVPFLHTWMPSAPSHTTRLPEMSALRSSTALSVSGSVIDPFQSRISSSLPSEACQTTCCPEIAGA